MRWTRVVRPALVLWAGLSLSPREIVAQRWPTVTTQARTALDSWLVTRFRDAQLLDDSVAVRPSGAVRFPRVESVRAGASDTLYAVHFGGPDDVSALRVASLVRLSGPSGAMTTHSARILARRAFRAPGALSANASSPESWRYGWSYVAVVTRGRRPAQASGFRGWLLVASPDSQTMVRPNAPPPR